MIYIYYAYIIHIYYIFRLYYILYIIYIGIHTYNILCIYYIFSIEYSLNILYIVYVWKICPALYLRITWLTEFCRIFLSSFNIWKTYSNMFFFVFIWILKFDFNSVSILSFSWSYKNVSMYTTRCTKNLGKQPSKWTTMCKTLRKEPSRSWGRNFSSRNQIRKQRKQLWLRIYMIFKICSYFFKIIPDDWLISLSTHRYSVIFNSMGEDLCYNFGDVCSLLSLNYDPILF